VNGTPEDLILFEGNRTFKELYEFIRQIKPMVPERISTAERLNQLRNQLSHHLVAGLLFDRAPMVVAQVERALYDMQLKNPLIKFVLIEDSSVMPIDTVMNAVSPLILVRHPIFEPHLGYYENVIISYREDGTSIDDDLTVKNIK
jgi:hypothetical protein